MSQEEFDNRLKSSFEDEYLPPGDHLWANISDRLEQKSGRPVWYWLLPVLLLTVAGLGWLAGSLSREETKTQTALKPALETQAETQAETAVNAAENELGSAREQGISIDSEKPGSGPVRESITGSNHAPSVPLRAGNAVPAAGNIAAPGQTELPLSTAAGLQSETGQKIQDLVLHVPFPLLKISGMRKFMNPFALPEISIGSFTPVKLKSTPAPEKKKYRQSSQFADLNSRHWLNFGIAPQQSINKIDISNDSQAWVHRQLWDNKYKMTGNGIGLHAFVSYAYKFGKKQQFSFETGLDYTLRTENIRLNENSYDIASRDSSNRIQKYVRVILLQLVVYNPVTGKNDTTNYLASSSYSMAVSNRYHSITVPLHVNAEFKLSPNTYVSAGLGGGVSLISSRSSEHMDMIWGESKTQGASRSLTASLSSRLALYTNFNDYGQIGIYSGFRTYLSPWEINTKQYAIKMSDLQFGITFRKPL